MTDYLMDIASYQRGIDLAVVRAAGFTIANIKTSEGIGYTFSEARSYANAARANGMRVSLFHYLNGGASGAAQADYAWRTTGPIISDVGPVAFQVDNESTATWEITRDFVRAISDKLGHLPYMYTGDWWAASRMSWDVHSLTPWLMAAPNAGYPGSYPGDASPQWWAGYWGYENLSLMQYAVSPITNAGGGSISKTAIRDPGLWAALTGGDEMETTTPIGNTGTPALPTGRNVGQTLGDVWNDVHGIGRGEIGPTDPRYPKPGTPARAALELPGAVGQLAGAVADQGVRLDAVHAAIDALQTGQVSQEAVNAAVLAAVGRPDVLEVIADAIASKLAARLAE